MKQIKSFYRKLAQIGVDEITNLLKAKQIRIININALIFIHISIIFSIHDAILNIPIDSTIGHIVTITIMCLVMYLNYINKQLTSKILWLSYSIISITVFSVLIEPGTHTEYFLLCFPAASLCIFSKNSAGYFLIPICFFLFSIPYYIIPVYPDVVINNLQISVEFVFSVAIFLMVVYFKTQNEKNEKLLNIEKDKVLTDKIILEEQQRELKTLSEFKSHFFVNISHEIRTPLTLINGYIDLLDFDKSKTDNNNHIQVVNQQLEEIKTITDNILDLSKIDENKIILNKQAQSVNLFLQKIYDAFKTVFNQKKITFIITLLENDVKVLFDDELMTRSINNIINNALKFTPENGQVTINATIENEDLQISLIDNGIGIPKNELEKVFDRFYQTKNNITKSKGSGIGLAFTKNILNEHGYFIEAKNNPEIGTNFIVKIPKEFFFKENSIQKIDIVPITKTDKKTILLVDDHQQMRFYVKNLLNNFNVIEAENGKVALDIITTTKIDLLVTDYMMPVMDGWKLVKKVKENNFNFPVIVITARVDQKGKLAMLRLGIDNYFTKPFYKEEFLKSVQNALNYFAVLTDETTKNNATADTKQIALFEKQLKKIIADNITNNSFGVEDVATKMNVSSKTLTRKTKLSFGQTPNQLIIEFRLLKAKEILDNNPETSITEITQLIGIKNSSYFKKRFEKRFEEVVV